MTLNELGSLGEFLGAVGVISSLLYLAYQVKQARLQIKGSAAQARTDSVINLWSARLVAPGFGDAWMAVRTDPGSLTDGQKAQVEFALIAQVQHLQNMFYQRKLGLLDHDQSLLLESMRTLTGTEYGRNWWREYRTWGSLPCDFVAHVDAMVARHEAGEVS
jgi:hypothetical protein